jgi:hypothetical protein
VAFRVLAGGEHPHFTTVNDFRLQHRDALAALFVQALKLCSRAGMRTVGHVSLDGTKVQANASKHKAMSYGRMKEEEIRLLGEIEKLLFCADEADASEDERYGRDRRGDELPDELARRETRLSRIREAKQALEQEAAEARAAHLRVLADEQRRIAETALEGKERRRAATQAAKSEAAADELAPRDDDDGDGGSSGTPLPSHQVPTTPSGEPTDKAQRNFTDPDSRIMIQSGGFVQAYNAQAAVSDDQVIVAVAVTNQAPDSEHLAPMVERVIENCGAPPEIFTADSGYWSAENGAYCEAQGVDAYIAVGRKTDEAALGRLPMSDVQDARWQMHEKVRSPEGRKIYARRKVIPEPVFGLIKRVMRFRRFSLRGLAKVSAEWAIVCTCYNLLRLFWAGGGLSAAA